MDHQQLIKLSNRLKEGDNSVLRVIYESHADYCIQKLIRKTGITREEAEDIFIESVMNFREKLISNKLEYLDSERPYIYKTCFNMHLARVEHVKRWQRKRNDIERFYYDTGCNDEEVPRDDLVKATRAAWEQLSEKCKDIIAYFYIDKLSMEEIARLMQLNNADVAKTTKSRCYRKFVSLANKYLKGN